MAGCLLEGHLEPVVCDSVGPFPEDHSPAPQLSAHRTDLRRGWSSVDYPLPEDSGSRWDSALPDTPNVAAAVSVIVADVVEGTIIEAVLRVTDNLELPEPQPGPTPDTEGIQAQLDELADVGQGELPPESGTPSGPLQARLTEARRTERRTPVVSEMDWGPPGQLRASWDGLSLAQRRQAIELFVERVVIAPSGAANTVDPGRVSVVWRA